MRSTDERGRDERKLIGVDEACDQSSVSQVYTYKVIRKLNAEMRENGCLVVPRKISRSFFEGRFFGAEGSDVGSKVAPEADKGDEMSVSKGPRP